MATQSGGLGSRLHNILSNRNIVNQHTSEAAGVFSPSSINHSDVGNSFYLANGLGSSVSGGIANLGNGFVIAGLTNAHISRSTNQFRYGAPFLPGESFLDLVDLSATVLNISTVEYVGNGIVLASGQDIFTVAGHIFLSPDFGNSWTDEGSITVNTITKIRYLGKQFVIFTESGGFVYRSADGGSTWPLAIAVTVVQLNTAEYLDNGIVLVGDNSGKIWRSTNITSGFPSFSQVTSIGTAIRSIQYLSNGVVIAGDNNGHIFRSTDFGASWIDLGVIDGLNNIVITLTYVGNGVALAGIISGTGGRVYRSTDYGATWINLTPAAFISVNPWNAHTLQYLGNGVTVIADSTGAIYRNDISYKTDEFIERIPSRIRFITTTTTLSQNDETILVSASGGSVTVNLPTFSSLPNGTTYTIKKIDSSVNIVTIDPSGTQPLEGVTSGTYVLTVQYQSVTIKLNTFGIGALGWWII